MHRILLDIGRSKVKTNRFVLGRSCFLVKGVKRGAIYNLDSGDVYSIDESAMNIIAACENGALVSEIIAENQSIDRKEIVGYFHALEKQGLGYFAEVDENIGKITLNEPRPLEFIWLELTTRCNLQCEHCYIGENSTQQRAEVMSSEDWIRVLLESYKIGCRNVQFIGGEPLLHENLKELVLEARNTGYEFIEIFTNGTLMTQKDWKEFLLKNGVQVAVSVYGPSAEIHDSITHRPGSFNRTMQTIEFLSRYKIPLRVAMIVMRKNQDFIESTRNFLERNFGIKNFKYDLVRPAGKGCGTEQVSDKLLERHQMYNPSFPHCSRSTFERAKAGHQCFSREVCVTATGDVFPCIMERDIVLGNILNQSVENILGNEPALEIRRLNKDAIKTCKDCEYRYACFDCRPKASGNSPDKDLYAKPAECHYDPYEGVWNNK